MSDRSLAILGGGQLGQMLAESARSLGIEPRCLDPDPGACAGRVCDLTVAPFDDDDAVRTFCEGASAVTAEWESIPTSALRAAQQCAAVRPGVLSFQSASDRFAEQEVFARLEIPAPEWRPVASPIDLDAARGSIGMPGVLKARRDGYDGKGLTIVTPQDFTEEAHARICRQDAIYQEHLAFEREISVVLARTAEGEIRVFPVCENTHKQGMLLRTIAPSPTLSAPLADDAIEYASLIASGLEHVGVLAVEFFVVGTGPDQRVLANEIAPRVHNSGHWTALSCNVSQFEQHVRAVVGMPLVQPELRGPAGMLNIIGNDPTHEQIAELEQIPGLDVVLYGKPPRPGRKLGHVSVCADSPEERDERMEQAGEILGEPAFASA